MAAQPCKECKARPKALPAQRCAVCALRHAPIGDQVDACRRRLAMVPESLRLKRSKKTEAAAPSGTSWCAACQTFRDFVDFGKGATTCKACASARSHAARTEKTYGLTAAQYDELLRFQGGACAICRGKPKSKRLAVDHSHTTGAVRGLLCSRCNSEALGSLHDSLELAWNAYAYLSHPPATSPGGVWDEYLSTSRIPREALSASLAAEEPKRASFAAIGRDKPGAAATAPATAIKAVGPKERTGIIGEIHAMTPEGLELIGGTRDERGAVRIYVPRHPDASPPF